MRLRTIAAGIAAATLTMATPAAADVFSNDLDDTVDTDAESMFLQYDTQGTHTSSDDIAGVDVDTRLRIEVDGIFIETAKKEHPRCNLNGDAHYATLAATTLPAGIAEVSFPGGRTFDSCDDTLVVRVKPLAPGHAEVRFRVDESKTPANVTLDVRGADFNIHVVDTNLDSDDPSTGTKCDRDPAAPAWANAILKANDVKLKGHDRRDVIRSVARQMGKAAAFQTDGGLVSKATHPGYEDAVYAFMQDLPALGSRINAVGPRGMDRPDRVCTTVTAD